MPKGKSKKENKIVAAQDKNEKVKQQIIKLWCPSHGYWDSKRKPEIYEFPHFTYSFDVFIALMDDIIMSLKPKTFDTGKAKHEFELTKIGTTFLTNLRSVIPQLFCIELLMSFEELINYSDDYLAKIAIKKHNFFLVAGMYSHDITYKVNKFIEIFTFFIKKLNTIFNSDFYADYLILYVENNGIRKITMKYTTYIEQYILYFNAQLEKYFKYFLSNFETFTDHEKEFQKLNYLYYDYVDIFTKIFKVGLYLQTYDIETSKVVENINKFEQVLYKFIKDLEKKIADCKSKLPKSIKPDEINSRVKYEDPAIINYIFLKKVYYILFEAEGKFKDKYDKVMLAKSIYETSKDKIFMFYNIIQNLSEGELLLMEMRVVDESDSTLLNLVHQIVLELIDMKEKNKFYFFIFCIYYLCVLTNIEFDFDYFSSFMSIKVFQKVSFLVKRLSAYEGQSYSMALRFVNYLIFNLYYPEAISNFYYFDDYIPNEKEWIQILKICNVISIFPIMYSFIVPCIYNSLYVHTTFKNIDAVLSLLEFNSLLLEFNPIFLQICFTNKMKEVPTSDTSIQKKKKKVKSPKSSGSPSSATTSLESKDNDASKNSTTETSSIIAVNSARNSPSEYLSEISPSELSLTNSTEALSLTNSAESSPSEAIQSLTKAVQSLTNSAEASPIETTDSANVSTNKPGPSKQKFQEKKINVLRNVSHEKLNFLFSSSWIKTTKKNLTLSDKDDRFLMYLIIYENRPLQKIYTGYFSDIHATTLLYITKKSINHCGYFPHVSATISDKVQNLQTNKLNHTQKIIMHYGYKRYTKGENYIETWFTVGEGEMKKTIHLEKLSPILTRFEFILKKVFASFLDFASKKKNVNLTGNPGVFIC